MAAKAAPIASKEKGAGIHPVLVAISIDAKLSSPSSLATENNLRARSSTRSIGVLSPKILRQSHRESGAYNELVLPGIFKHDEKSLVLQIF
jgi:hypothetical protein